MVLYKVGGVTPDYVTIKDWFLRHFRHSKRLSMAYSTVASQELPPKATPFPLLLRNPDSTLCKESIIGRCINDVFMKVKCLVLYRKSQHNPTPIDGYFLPTGNALPFLHHDKHSGYIELSQIYNFTTHFDDLSPQTTNPVEGGRTATGNALFNEARLDQSKGRGFPHASDSASSNPFNITVHNIHRKVSRQERNGSALRWGGHQSIDGRRVTVKKVERWRGSLVEGCKVASQQEKRVAKHNELPSRKETPHGVRLRNEKLVTERGELKGCKHVFVITTISDEELEWTKHNAVTLLPIDIAGVDREVRLWVKLKEIPGKLWHINTFKAMAECWGEFLGMDKNLEVYTTGKKILEMEAVQPSGPDILKELSGSDKEVEAEPSFRPCASTGVNGSRNKGSADKDKRLQNGNKRGDKREETFVLCKHNSERSRGGKTGDIDNSEEMIIPFPAPKGVDKAHSHEERELEIRGLQECCKTLKSFLQETPPGMPDREKSGGFQVVRLNLWPLPEDGKSTRRRSCDEKGNALRKVSTTSQKSSKSSRRRRRIKEYLEEDNGARDVEQENNDEGSISYSTFDLEIRSRRWRASTNKINKKGESGLSVPVEAHAS
ncbi:Uncharacterized protein TCM_026286 [Theobroma cacao]|uniref:DUF4283 domain-containing protein n=1 Tax=Theobroma cacao TaxID=3641 RepID=A0A061F0Y9_THECC|nr:Uncharacterized protein TCM_026286 [Theobroma cacao]